MKIAVLSDSHDHLVHIAKAFSLLRSAQVDVLIHCGDLCAPFIIDELDGFGVPVHVIFGNIDDRINTPKKASASKQVTHHGETAQIVLGGKKIAVNHYPQVARELAESGKYDAVFYGHNHVAAKEKVGACLLVNPGEVMGRKGRPSVGVYDTSSGSFEHIEF